jgi:hypothetical protein
MPFTSEAGAKPKQSAVSQQILSSNPVRGRLAQRPRPLPHTPLLEPGARAAAQLSGV